MEFLRDLGRTLARNPVSTFAAICVAAIAFILWSIADRLIKVVESPDWCAKALQAERISSENFGGLTACNTLLEKQVTILGTSLHIVLPGFVFSLVVLVVVFVAGARANFKLGAGGISGDVSRDAKAGAEHVREAANEAADDVLQAVPPAQTLAPADGELPESQKL